MIANDILLDAFTRVHESLHRTLGDITPGKLVKEPHPSIGWLAWRITRVMDSNVSRLSGREQLWIGDEWAAQFGMPPDRPTMVDRPDIHASKSTLSRFDAATPVDQVQVGPRQLLIYDLKIAKRHRLSAYKANFGAEKLPLC